MFCEHCGKETSENAAYCTYCGLKHNEIRRIVEKEGTPITATRQGSSFFGAGRQTFQKNLLKALIAATLLVAGAAIIAFVWAAIATPGNANIRLQEILFAPDDSMSVFLTHDLSARMAGNGTTFVSGEAMYVRETGIPKNSHFTFRIIGSNGTEALNYSNFGFELSASENETQGGKKINDEGNPFPAGEYRADLIRIKDNTGFVVASTNFTVNATYSQDVLSRIHLSLLDKNEADMQFRQELSIPAINGINVEFWVEGPIGRSIPGEVVVIGPDNRDYAGFSFRTSPSGIKTYVSRLKKNASTGQYYVAVRVNKEEILRQGMEIN